MLKERGRCRKPAGPLPWAVCLVGALWALVLGALPAAGQEGGLRARFGQLFTFGTGCGPEVLFCLRSGSGTADFAQEAFSTNANATARELTLFLQGAIALGVATAPVPSAGTGETFRLSALGVPVRAEEASLGPVLSERALTVGRRSFLVGANFTEIRFENLRGTSLEDLQFNVVQRDLPPLGPPLGDPAIERTYLAVTTRMGFEARVVNLFVTAGVTDRLDLSVMVPLVQATISGFSDAEIVVGEGEDPAAGFSFGGPTEDPRLRERSVLPLERASGLGDISLRGKYRFTSSESRLGAAFLGDIRLPSGREEDFLGSGAVWAQGLGILSVDAGAGVFPHVNGGLVLRSGEGQRNAVVVALGADHRTSSRLTLAVELLGRLPLGSNPLVQREVVIRDGQGIDTIVSTSNFPTLRDDQFDTAAGLKLRLWKLTFVSSVIVPLNDGGLRSPLLWTVGLQGGF
jgi:hypothetical protein